MASEPQGKDAERGAGGPGLVWLVLLSLSLFVLLLPIASYVAALSAIKDELGLNNAGAGALFSAYLAGYAASALFLVPLSDRLGPKRIMYVSAVLSVAAHLLFPLTTHDIVVGVVLRAIAGVGFLGVYIPGLRLVARRFERNGRGSAMGLFVTAQYASHSGSLALTGWLMATMEWRDAYTLVAGLSAVSLPLIFLLARSVSDAPPEVSRGRLDPTVLKSEPVQFVILGYTVHALNLYALRVWLPVFLATILVARGFSEGNAIVTAAEVGGLALAFGAVGPVMGGAVSDRLGRTTAASLILGVSAVCAVGLAWIGHWPWGLIVVVCVVFAWAASADSAIYQTSITEVADRTRLGSTMALQASLG
ncbi:MAG: MFS transporter, partial [Chloroflexota bacterium]|nr:MFS transporter [Chloroflexota bacterium]